MSKNRNHKGRRWSEPFVQLGHYLIDSVAYRAARPAARALLIELMRLYNGHNNGRIALSARDAAARLGCVPDTAARAFKELIRLGFIELVVRGDFKHKKRIASEYRLTMLPCDRTNAPASKAFTRWSDDGTTKRGGNVVNFPNGPINSVVGPAGRTVAALAQ